MNKPILEEYADKHLSRIVYSSNPEHKQEFLQFLSDFHEAVRESTIAEVEGKFTVDVEIEGCQASHDGEKCLHCDIEPCPHCRAWGGIQRSERRLVINSKKPLTNLLKTNDK